MSNDLLGVRFGDHSAFIECADLPVRQLLEQSLSHCLTPLAHVDEVTPAELTYFIASTADGKVQLQRSQLLLYCGSSPAHLIQRLVHDLASLLAAQSHQSLVFHAAGLAWAERGLMICGQSGSGKSTLAAWLVATGFDYLTDELVTISLDSSEMKGLTRPIILRKSSDFVWHYWLPEHAQRKLLHFPGGDVWSEPELLRPRCVRVSAYPHLLLFPRYQAGEPLAVQPLTQAMAAFQLMRCLINARNLPDQGLAPVTRLARQTVAYRLTYSELDPVVAWLKQLLAASSLTTGVSKPALKAEFKSPL